jgi:8-oxo-dGTP diphosphatase
MRYGISAAALVVRKGLLLLLRHQEPGRHDFWVPPGGRVEGEESVFECARRETYEETGLNVDPDRIVYIQEFIEPGYHFCKFFISCAANTGNITIENRGSNESFLVDARFFKQDELGELTVFPEILKGQFWNDFESGFPQTRYLGLEEIRE